MTVAPRFSPLEMIPMIFTKKMAAAVKRECRRNCMLGHFHDEQAGYGDLAENAGFNLLLVDDYTRDLTDQISPDELIGQEVPDVHGFLYLDVYVYGTGSDSYLIGNRLLLLDAGGLVWRSHGDNDKVGRVTAHALGILD